MKNYSIRLYTVLMITFFMVSVGIAGTKPLDGLPDYNGTYYGTPDTGSLYDPAVNRFTVLYRDNYNRDSGYAGEGYGKHPGVDIRIPSRTAVKATLGGIIVEAVCDWNGKRGLSNGATGFGGLVIIESDNPYAPGKVYITYSHLDNWSLFSVGQTVSEGQSIAYSGGDDTAGVCPGASTGAHLHFQVDKFAPTINSRGNLTPWYPTGQVETPDSNFEVMGKTYNPLPFVQGYGYHWYFSENGFKQLWTAANVNSYGVANNAFWVDGELSNVYVYRSGVHYPSCGGSDGYPCSREVAIESGIYKQWVLYLDFKCTSNPAVVWFRNSNDDWGGISFNYSGTGYYTIPMTISSDWTGTITDLFFQPAYGGGCTASPGPEEFFVYQTYFLP